MRPLRVAAVALLLAASAVGGFVGTLAWLRHQAAAPRPAPADPAPPDPAPKPPDPDDPVRDVHVWMPGFEKADSPFHPLFVERLKPFEALRFMDWQATNNSPVRAWAERATADDARWSTPKGLPVEVLVDLANRLGA